MFVKSAFGQRKKPVWNSGKFVTAICFLVPYQGGELQPIIKRVAGKNLGKPWKRFIMERSRSWQNGFKSTSDWKAKMD